jgi:phospholipase C
LQDPPYVSNIDPDHSVNSTTYKLFGGFNLVNPAPMSGFMDWEVTMQNHSLFGATDVINVFPMSRVPVITTLAENFAIIDAYHASVPGPTYPNRMYSMSATSHGAFTNDPPPGGWPQETIFEKLEQVGKTWNIFYHDCSWSLFFSNLRTSDRIARVKQWEFFKAAAADGALPNFSFLEPQTAMNPWTSQPASDQHPDHDIQAGENLIKEVYEALRNGPLWDKTLLVITYDEHGGFWDHVPPPMDGVPSPDGIPPEVNQTNYNFDRLGLRVPFILASPWIDKGVVEHSPTNGPTSTSQYEHSSIPSTLHSIFGTTSFLTKRDAWAAPFDHLISRTTPRKDCPKTLPKVPKVTPAELEEEGNKPLNSLQCDFVRGFEDSHGNCDMTQLEGAKYLRHLMEHHLFKYGKN